MLGPQCEDVDRRVPVVLRYGEAEAGEEHGQDYLGLHHGVGLTHTVSGPRSEGQEVSVYRKGFSGEPLRLKLMRIPAPYFLVMVDRQHRDPKRQALWNVKVAQLDVLECHPWQKARRRIQPQRLANYHVQLRQRQKQMQCKPKRIDLCKGFLIQVGELLTTVSLGRCSHDGGSSPQT